MKPDVKPQARIRNAQLRNTTTGVCLIGQLVEHHKLNNGFGGLVQSSNIKRLIKREDDNLPMWVVETENTFYFIQSWIVQPTTEQLEGLNHAN